VFSDPHKKPIRIGNGAIYWNKKKKYSIWNDFLQGVADFRQVLL
jgi:hypothetical protein